MTSVKTKRKKALKIYTANEEIAHSITHGFGIILSIVALVFLLVCAAKKGTAWHIVSFSIYGVSMILMYTMSTLYHSFSEPGLKRKLKIADHAAIYLLIAGSYTPFLLVNMRGPWGWSLFGVIWSLALAGIIYKLFFTGRFPRFSLFVYLLMGWLCVIALPEMIATIPFRGLMWMVAGGLFYTFGVIFYVWHRLPYHHAIWHLFVLAGSIAHFFAVLFYVLPA
ncbi:MAG: hemolysin III family protein [Bacteroidota bacterium]